MTCSNCGAPITADDTTCPACGVPVDARPSHEPPPPPTAAGTPATDQPPWGATPPPSAPGWGAATPHPSGLSSEVRGWGIGAHLSGLGGALLTVVTLGFLGPLLVWLIKREEHPFIEHHAKEALNFQLTSLVVAVGIGVVAVPVFLLGFLTLGVLWIVALVLLLVAAVAWFVFPILGAVRAANGEGFRYPVCIRFVR